MRIDGRDGLWDLPGLVAPESGYYLFTAYVAADKPGGLLGVNVNDTAHR